MSSLFLDATGLRCPQPLMKIAVLSADMKPGDTLEVVADCPTFENDVRTWCRRLDKIILMASDEGGYRRRIRIRF